jgi:hypothetical protein
MQSQSLRELSDNLGKCRVCSAGPGDHEDILWWHDLILATTEELAHQPSHPVANHRPADLPAGGNTEPRDPIVTSLRDDHKTGTRPATADPLQAEKLGALANPMCLRESLVVARLQGCFGGMLTVSRLRPLARRRFSTCRPVGVAMRALNPCVRLRRRLLG